jgi:hypothetical protein
MSPYEINILLHYFCRCDDHDDMVRNPPIWRLTIDRFLSEDLLARVLRPDVRHPMAYTITDRGRAYVQALQSVPLPVAYWKTVWPENVNENDTRPPCGNTVNRSA